MTAEENFTAPLKHLISLSVFQGVYARVSGGLPWIRQQICALSSYPPSYCSAGPTAPTPAAPAPVAPAPTVVAPPVPAPAPSLTYVNILVTVQYDKYPEEFAWRIFDTVLKTNVVNYPANYFSADYKLLSGTVDLVKGRTYQLRMTDTFGDGICCTHGYGYIQIMRGATPLISIDGRIGSSYTMSFVP